MYTTPSVALPPPLHIWSMGRYSQASGLLAVYEATIAVGSLAWPANNRAIYVPFRTDVPTIAARFFVYNGANATGNADIGIYNGNTGNLLVSKTTTARTGTNVLDYYTITDVGVPPGFWYLGLVLSSTTGSVTRSAPGTVSITRMAGLLQEDLGATTLPATMTPVAVSQAYVPLFGYSQSDTL